MIDSVTISVEKFLALVEAQNELAITKRELQLWKDANAHGDTAAWVYIHKTGLMPAYEKWCKENDAIPF